MDPVEKFGQLVVAQLRDRAIDHADGLLAGRWKAPGLLPLQTALAELSPNQKELIRRVLKNSLDSGIHDFLFAIGEAHDSQQGIAIIVDGHDVAALSDGLQGEPFGDEGWFAKFSKYGPHPNQC